MGRNGVMQQILRLIYINFVLFKHGLEDIILAAHLLRPLRWLFYLLPWFWIPRQRLPRGLRIRCALEDLGPIFVKFGQILSTRPDLLPADIAVELSALRDRVKPFDGRLARQLIERAYGQPLDEVFSEFNEQPLASASIAQVHLARLRDGREVVVKVLRPAIDKIIRRDVSLLYVIADLAERFWSDARRLRPREVVAEFEKTILDELDLMREAASASQLRRNFLDSPLLYVPEVYWPWCRKTVMVMERINGIPVDDLDALKRAGIDLKRLAENGVEIFFTQVFRDSFFHADMHPGNIFVDNNGRYLAVDFGIMGTLGPEDQRYLAENFLAFFKRDYRRVAQLHVNAGWVPGHTRVDEFESAIRSVCEPIFEKPLQEISFGQLLVRLFQTARRFNMEVQPQLVLLQKTLLNIEGLGRQLYPQLDLWQTAKPFLERWIRGQLGPKRLLTTLRESLPLMIERLPELPRMGHEILNKLRQGELAVQLNNDSLARIRAEIRRANRRTFSAIAGSGFILCATMILVWGGEALVTLGGVPLLSLMLGGLGAYVLIFSWPARRR